MLYVQSLYPSGQHQANPDMQLFSSHVLPFSVQSISFNTPSVQYRKTFASHVPSGPSWLHSSEPELPSGQQ
jgi:hypothetical protein